MVRRSGRSGGDLAEPDFMLNLYDDSPLAHALRSCEVYCDASCCGMKAFEVSPEELQRWAESVDEATLRRAREQVAEVLAELRSAPDEFLFLDTYHRRDEVREWFEQIGTSLGAARAAR
jgi:hypothetical protein